MVNWIDVTHLSFNSLLLLEAVQLSWFPGWVPEADLAVALAGNPAVEWYLRHKCPALGPWLDEKVCVVPVPRPTPAELRAAELAVMRTVNDLLTYAIDPAIYDAQPFLAWDSRELTELVDLRDQIVLDVGSGTGRLALVAAPLVFAVYAVEPVANLRAYLRTKARAAGCRNVYPVDGLIADLPFPPGFADITMSGHVFGDHPAEEWAELVRVTRPGGWVILCPGTAESERESAAHAFLVAQGCQWSRFEEPGDGWKRKYWKRV